MHAFGLLEKLLRQPLVVVGLLAFAAFLGSLYTSPLLLAVGLALTFAALAGIAWPLLSVVAITGTLRFDHHRGRDGDAVPIALTLRNWFPWPIWGLTLEPWGISNNAGGQVLAIPVVGAWSQTVVEFHPPAPGRGVYPRPYACIRCRFPFGFFTARRRLVVERPFTAWPARMTVRRFDDGFGNPSAVGTVFRNRPGTAGELLGVREYRRGDTLSQIHWRQTARMDRLIVCDRQSPARPELEIVIDMQRSAYGGVGTALYEQAVRIAGGLAEWAFARGARVDLYAPNRIVGHTRVALLDALANLPLWNDLSDEPQAALGLARGARIIVAPAQGLGDRWRANQATHWVVLDAEESATAGKPWPVWWTVTPESAEVEYVY